MKPTNKIFNLIYYQNKVISKVKLCAFILIITVSHAFSQDVSQDIITTQGNFDKTKTMTLQWTLGEPFTETISTETLMFSQGFQQSYIVKNIEPNDSHTKAIKVLVYPNPALVSVNIMMKDFTGIVNITITDLNGRIVKLMKNRIYDSTITIDVSSLQSGVYTLQFSNADGMLSNPQQLIKLN